MLKAGRASSFADAIGYVLRLVHDEIKNALGGEGHRLRAMLEVLYSIGIRISELLGLNLGDVDFSNAPPKC